MLFFEKGKKYNGLATSIVIILLGTAIIGLNILSYQSRLPQTITNENSSLIQQQGYTFYVILLGGKIVVLFGIRKLYLYYKIKSAERLNETRSPSQMGSVSSSSPSSLPKPSLISIIVDVIGNKNSLKVFLPVVVAYGLFYSIASSILIFRAEGFHHTTGLTAPYVTMMTHGPIGYAPSVALGITDHIGLLIIPINLVILCAVSGLVGLNAVLSTYVFLNRQKKKQTLFATNNATSIHINGSPLVTAMGASTGIFAVCPTCASLYIFGVLTGSFASTITTFGVAFYGLFAAISIPLLVVSPFITASSLRKMFGSGMCYLKK